MYLLLLEPTMRPMARKPGAIWRITSLSVQATFYRFRVNYGGKVESLIHWCNHFTVTLIERELNFMLIESNLSHTRNIIANIHY